jgi:hypothetical protein
MNRGALINIILIFSCLSVPAAACANPNLSLYIDDEYGGAYDATTETWVTASDEFVLQAIVPDDDVLNGQESVDLYLCIALSDDLYTLDGNGDVVFNDGMSLTVNGVDLLAHNFDYGLPPLTEDNTDGGGGDLAPHDWFPTAFTEIVTSIDGAGTYEFLISNAVPGIHFDLYTLDEFGQIDSFAPFSHDAETGTPPVPEPATLALAIGGLLLLPLGIRFRKK